MTLLPRYRGGFFTCVLYLLHMFYTRKAKTRLYVAYICQAIYGFEYCKPEDTLARLTATDHPYNKMWSRICSFYNKNGYYSLTDRDIETMFHKYALHGMQITRNGNEELIPVGAMYEAQALWKKYSWYDYEVNRNDRRNFARKTSIKIAVTALAVAIGGPIGGTAGAWAADVATEAL